jgi:methylthioribose-1-phosphate isomerase
MIPTLEWTADGVRFLDQTRLPLEETYVLATTSDQVANVITTMVVRGAPAIGVAAAMGVALGIKNSSATTLPALTSELEAIAKTLAPRALRRSISSGPSNACAAVSSRSPPSPASPSTPSRQGWSPRHAPCTTRTSPPAAPWAHTARLMPASGGVLTHCNAGALASCGYGMALGVIRAAVERGHQLHVYADETRPFLQGARLTAWEMMHDGIPTTVLCDNMAASLMRQGKIQAVIVGSDRVAANGDVANKIGTYGVAILAKEHGIPFYVACPWSTIDLATANGDAIPIEQRPAIEVTHHGGKQLTPHGVGIENPPST